MQRPCQFPQNPRGNFSRLPEGPVIIGLGWIGGLPEMVVAVGFRRPLLRRVKHFFEAVRLQRHQGRSFFPSPGASRLE
ncbi:hypothetical protein D3C76_1560770 [compost metagenome]